MKTYFKHQKYPSFFLSEPNYFLQSASGYPVLLLGIIVFGFTAKGIARSQIDDSTCLFFQMALVSNTMPYWSQFVAINILNSHFSFLCPQLSSGQVKRSQISTLPWASARTKKYEFGIFIGTNETNTNQSNAKRSHYLLNPIIHEVIFECYNQSRYGAVYKRRHHFFEIFDPPSPLRHHFY